MVLSLHLLPNNQILKHFFLRKVLFDLTRPNMVQYTYYDDGTIVYTEDTPEDHKCIPINLQQKGSAELRSDWYANAYQITRAKQYPNLMDMIVPLWERVVEGKTDATDELQAKRTDVKNRNPKPTE